MCVFLVFLLEFTLINGKNITISTQLGLITGIEENNYAMFRGIPYTEYAPVGNYRFSESIIKNTSYIDNPYDATYYRNICMQIPSFIDPQPMSEDCLYLNIWTPNTNSTQLLPVMFWIHGGGFTSGSGSWSLYDGKAFMNEQDVIYVSINYRLGSLGYVSLQSILNETNGKTTGGLNGINDQIVALQWIQKYITDFGGDLNRVTIFGESAGGFSICMLLYSEYAQNLFSQAIIQSGPCLGFPSLSYNEGLMASQTVLNNANLTDDLNLLRQLNAETFVNLNANIGGTLVGADISVDGYIMQYQINQTTLQNPLNANKVIIGSVSLDTAQFYKADTLQYISQIDKPPTNEYELDYYLKTYIDNTTQIDLIKNEYYPINDYPQFIYFDQIFTNYSMIWYSINADICFICPSIEYMQILQDNNNNNNDIIDIYLYLFEGAQSPYYVPHAGELPFLFNSSFMSELFGIPFSNLLSDVLIDAWKQFVIYGKPNSSYFPEQWTNFPNGMRFINENGQIENDFVQNYKNNACNFWINQVDTDVVASLCMQSLPVSEPDADKNQKDTWEIVVISIGVAFVLLIIIIILIKYKCCCLENKKDYSKMEENATSELAIKVTDGQYGAVTDH